MYVIRANVNIFESFERKLISALLGPRRVGKTTLVQYYIEKYGERKWVILTMNQLSQRNRIAQEELELMIEEAALQKIGGDKKSGFLSMKHKSALNYLIR
jgi:predicted AAA+ superfamily ATPase